jgi:pyridoxamine 5'-phosphate oxidase
MEYAKVLRRVFELVDESRVGIMTTVDAEGYPCARWMTPAVLTRLSGDLYSVTQRDSAKVARIAANPRVAWTFQTKSLDRIASLQGQARVFEDPGLVAEVIEEIGRYLTVLWRVNPVPGELVVIETMVERASIYLPRRREFYEAESGHGE